MKPCRRTLPRLLLPLCAVLLWFPGAAAAAATTRLTVTGSAGTPATLELARSPLRAMMAIPLRLQLQPGRSQPHTLTTVACDLTMPAMPMPPNRPVLQGSGADFRGEAVFTMAGDWQVDCILPGPAGGEERFRFTLPPVLLP